MPERFPAAWRARLDRVAKNERVLWAGRPDSPFLRCVRHSLPLTLAVLGIPGLFICASFGMSLYAGQATWEDARRHLAGPYLLPGIAFVVLVWFPALCYFYGLKTLYVVTDKRLIQIRFIAGETVKSVKPDGRLTLRVAESGGRSTVHVAKVVMRDGKAVEERSISFYDVRDGRELERTLREAFEWAPSAASAPPSPGVDKEAYFRENAKQIFEGSYTDIRDLELEVRAVRPHPEGLDAEVEIVGGGNVQLGHVRLIVGFTPGKFPAVVASYAPSKAGDGWTLTSHAGRKTPPKHLPSI
jgi:hypothetical protein